MSNYTEITLNLGETWTIDATINHRDLTNLDGCQIFWRFATNAKTVLEVKIGSGVTILDSNAKTCRIVVPTSLQVNKGVKFGNYFHELVIQLPDGSTSIQVEGPVTVKQTLSSKYPW